jgi:protein CsiD
MSGKFYARFTVKHTDDSDSYLRQAYRRLELHTDGTFVDEKTDWVLMQKLESLNCKGGESLLLHLDDWGDLNKFYEHPLAKENIQWSSPPSKNISEKVYHPVFFDGPCMSFIDQFAEPQNMEEGIYLNDISESLETDPNTIAIDIPDNGILIINNSFWLHGRDEIKENINLSRELLRQRGVFA